VKFFKALASLPPQTRRNVFRRVGQMVFFDSLFALLLFIPAGSARWLWAWVYVGLMVGIQLVGASFMPLEVLAERGSKKENTEAWDRTLTRLILPAYTGLYLVAGLDYRGHWTAGYALTWHLVGTLLFILGCALVQWAMYANAFFSTAVRIQYDRGHRVCSGGPYRYVRHPGYVGMILYFSVTPLLLGSLWALVPALVAASLVVVRTALEDRTLQASLSGYREYAARVRWRLLPGIW
jgi:protein-S-isoprenylcysteine O-methyltransferase Ste14